MWWLFFEGLPCNNNHQRQQRVGSGIIVSYVVADVDALGAAVAIDVGGGGGGGNYVKHFGIAVNNLSCKKEKNTQTVKVKELSAWKKKKPNQIQ